MALSKTDLLGSKAGQQEKENRNEAASEGSEHCFEKCQSFAF